MKRTLASLVLVTAVLVQVSSPAGAQLDSDRPWVERPLGPVGETEVNYYSGGALTNSTRIPSDSAFVTSGRGSAGAPSPCFSYNWTVEEPNPDAVVGPVTGGLVDRVSGEPTTETRIVLVSQPSTAWIFNEVTPTGQWSPVAQADLDEWGAGPGGLGGVTMTSTVTLGESYFAANAPLAEASRRFGVYCGVPDAYVNGTATYGPDGPLLRYQEIGLQDPFWNPLVRVGHLWGMVQLPAFGVISPPEVTTWGGLIVNMPTWLQIEAAVWRPYFTGVDEYMGWRSQLGLFPRALQFEVVGEGGGTVPCAPVESAPRNGAIPGWPTTPTGEDDLPRYWELGQLGRDCTWVPQAKGSVTIRARITYDVLLTISGYSEWLSPYQWYSDPLTLSVGELRVRNVTPEGGFGG